MLGFFRINDPLRLIGVLLLLIVVSIPLFIHLPTMTISELKGMVIGETKFENLFYVKIIDSTPLIMAAYEKIAIFLFGRSILARHILALIFILVQSIYFGFYLVGHKSYKESIYVPILLYVSICFFSFCMISLSAELFGSAFLMIALANIFKEFQSWSGNKTFCFHIGFYLGIASLFVFSYSVFLIPTILILVILHRTTAHNILFTLFGFIFIHVILWTVYYCMDSLPKLWVNFYLPNLTPIGSNLISTKNLLKLGTIPLIFFGLSILQTLLSIRISKTQTQYYQVYFFWLFGAAIVLWISPNRSPISFLPCLPVLAYCISQYFLNIKQKWIAEILFILFLGTLITRNFSDQWTLKYQEYTAIFPKKPLNKTIQNKKIMVLDNDCSWYINNQSAGYFVNWEISKKYFEQPNDYENITLIHESFVQEMPDIIIDPSNHMPPVLSRIPWLNSAYKKEGDIYRRI